MSERRVGCDHTNDCVLMMESVWYKYEFWEKECPGFIKTYAGRFLDSVGKIRNPQHKNFVQSLLYKHKKFYAAVCDLIIERAVNMK